MSTGALIKFGWEELLSPDLVNTSVGSVTFLTLRPSCVEGFILTINRYKSDVYEIAKTGMLISLTVVLSLVTSTWSPFPKVPLFNARPDFWFGMAVISLIFLDKKYRILFIVALPFALIPSELSDAYAGFGDYMIELAAPMIILLLSVFIPRKIWQKIIFMCILFFLYFIARLFFMTYAGVIFWQTPWSASLTYNVWNVLLDFLVSLPFLLLGLFKLIKIKGI